MGRISINDADKYGNNGRNGADFFSLKDDKDTAHVRFMYNDISDVSMDVVHEVEVDGKKRYVNCLRSYGESADACPLCKAGVKQSVKMFIPLYNVDEKKVQIWQRGKTFANNISSLMSRCESPMCRTIVEIERNGKKGDQGTTYITYPGKSDDTTLEDLPEIPELLGGLIMDKSYDELSKFVETGSFHAEDIQPRSRRNPGF